MCGNLADLLTLRVCIDSPGKNERGKFTFVVKASFRGLNMKAKALTSIVTSPVSYYAFR